MSPRSLNCGLKRRIKGTHASKGLDLGRKLGNNQKKGIFDRYPITSMINNDKKKCSFYSRVFIIAKLTFFCMGLYCPTCIYLSSHIQGAPFGPILILAAIQKRTESRERAHSCPLPGGFALINELKVQRCSVRHRCRVMSLPGFSSAAEGRTIEKGVVCGASLISCATVPASWVLLPSFSPASSLFMACKK